MKYVKTFLNFLTSRMKVHDRTVVKINGHIAFFLAKFFPELRECGHNEMIYQSTLQIYYWITEENSPLHLLRIAYTWSEIVLGNINQALQSHRKIGINEVTK